VIAWWELTLTALFAVAVIDLSLFGWSLRAVGLGRRFDGPTPGERVTVDRKVSVHYGRVATAWGWNGPLIVTDRRIVSCWGYWSRVAVLDIARSEVTEVTRGWWWYPCVRVGYRRERRLRSFRIVGIGLKLFRMRDELLAAFRSAGYPVVT
jgi:hypothetical protein